MMLTTAMTDVTPITTPSSVRTLRILCAQRLDTAMRTASPNAIVALRGILRVKSCSRLSYARRRHSVTVCRGGLISVQAGVPGGATRCTIPADKMRHHQMALPKQESRLQMRKWSRREVLKTAVVAPAAARALVSQAAPAVRGESVSPQNTESNPAASARERLLLDFGWRFHLGHADDSAQDFGFGRRSEFAKSGEIFRPSQEDFDDSEWQAIDLPHDWAVELPFVDDPGVNETGAKPLGRAHPTTSIGWYRRVFEIPQSDLGRRLSLEFDGVFRDSIVALNGHFLARNLSGYAPFRCDITDFANYGGKNVLVVRADAT